MASKTNKTNNSNKTNVDELDKVAALRDIASRQPTTREEDEQSKRASLILSMIDAGADLALAQDCIEIVKETRGFIHHASKIAALNLELQQVGKTQRETRHRLMAILQRNSHRNWNIIKKPIKLAIAASGYADVNGFLGVLKTCFEERILPTDLNADRLRKSPSWIAWTGETIARAAKPKATASTPAASTPAASTASTPAASTPAATTTKATPAASTPAASTPAASTPAASTPAASTPAASTPAASTPAASTPAASTPAASTPAATKATPAASTASTTPTAPTRVNVNANDSLTTLEHWQTIHQQWMHHRLNMYYVQELSGILGIGPDKLQMALAEAGKALVNRASKK